MKYKYIGQLLKDASPPTSLRGDSYLYQAICDQLHEQYIFNPENMTKEISQTFEALTGQPLTSNKPFHVECFSNGGQSSGMVSPDHWREVIIPLVCDYYQKHQVY